MALNLSTLTSPATSGDVLQEALTTADFLEPCPVLRNLSRGSNKGGDAKQDVALNQPKALPLIKNPQGNLGGYLYIPDVSGNYAEGPSVTIGANQTWEGEVDMVITQWGSYIAPMGGGSWSSGFGILFYGDGDVRSCSKGVSGDEQPSGVTLGTPFNAKYGYDGTNQYVKINDSVVWSNTAVDQISSITQRLRLSAHDNLTHQGNYAIQKAKLTVNSAVVFDCDFNGSTSIRHGDTKFQASVGGPVTITQFGNDPATIIKKPVLRFDGVNDGFKGLFNQTITDGYMFAAFSVLGDGGESGGRLFGVNPTTGGTDASAGFIFGYKSSGSVYQSLYNGGVLPHLNTFDDERGDILIEAKIESGNHSGRVNNADFVTGGNTGTRSGDEFNVAANDGGANNAAIDLEYLALFPATITDDQAADVVKYINNRNNVFDLKDGFGYYFYDAQNAPVGNISSGSSSWNGRIVGSDFGDTDRYLTQGTSDDQPVGDGYVVNFADNTDHLEIPQVTQAGWQVVGTSLGTFAYKVNANAVTELNLLGNLGSASYRKAGELYGIILLPASATGKDINEAKKLLTDRGASVSATAVVTTAWRGRSDIVQFDGNMSDVTYATAAWRFCSSLESFSSNLPEATNVRYAWNSCTSLTSFSSELPSATNVSFAWNSCTSLSDFRTTDIKNCTDFTSAWQSCSALTSFPAGAKLGTEANNVNFSEAWRSSGLTSFPADINLIKGTTFANTWRQSGLTSFPDIQSTQNGTTFLNAWYNCASMTSFGNANLDKGGMFQSAWNACYNLEDFPALFTNWNPSTITTGVFNVAWDGCTSLTADSVENILTSIDSSGKYATSTGASGDPALADGGIDIDYNVATGSLSAATTAAITSLKSKGWSIFINSVEQ